MTKVAELDHGVKNILACLAAAAKLSRDYSKSADPFLKGTQRRIAALANTQALLSRSG
jgi:two-component sensor histidine kinase